MKMFLISDNVDTLTGMRLAGVEGVVVHEREELREALESGRGVDAPHGIREELGDALFMAAKVGQMTGVDPEDALHRACDKFDARFRSVEQAADKPLSDYDEAGLIELWKAAKAREKS